MSSEFLGLGALGSNTWIVTRYDSLLGKLGDWVEEALSELNVVDTAYRVEKWLMEAEEPRNWKYSSSDIIEIRQRAKNRVVREYLQEMWEIGELNNIYELVSPFLFFYLDPYAEKGEMQIVAIIENEKILDLIMNILSCFEDYVEDIKIFGESTFELEQTGNKLKLYKKV